MIKLMMMMMMDLWTNTYIFWIFLFPITILMIRMLPIAATTSTTSAFVASSTTTSNSCRRNFLGSLLSGCGSLFLSNNNNNKKLTIDYFDNGPYEYRDGYVQVPRRHNHQKEVKEFSLYYRLYNPQSKQTPIVICHGGPSLPSQYLYPLVPILSKEEEEQEQQHRPILFFDQLGCGKSDEPNDLSFYSIDDTVQDLYIVISKVLSEQYKSFHLYGHSFGGIIAYEYYYKYYAIIYNDNNNHHQQQQPKLVSSLILSNAPTDLGKANANYDKLYSKNPLKFWTNHACKIGIPPILEDAFQNSGSLDIWSGMDAIPNYSVVSKPLLVLEATNRNQKLRLFPPVLILSSSNDFSYIVSNEVSWRNVFFQQQQQQQSSESEVSAAATTITTSSSSTSKKGITTTTTTTTSRQLQFTAINFENCAHYPFYEDPKAYGKAINGFLDKMK